MATLNDGDITKLTNISDAVGTQIQDTVVFVNSQIITLIAELSNIVPFFSPSVSFDNKNIMKQIALDDLPQVSPTGNTSITGIKPDVPTGLTDRAALPEAVDPALFDPEAQSVEFPNAASLEKTADGVIIPSGPELVGDGLQPEAPSPLVKSGPTSPTSDDLPDVVNVEDIIVPEVPVVEFAAFGEALPPFDLVLPDFTLSFTEAPYSSALLSATSSRLLNDVQNGGTGLGADIEQDIFDRAVERDGRQLDIDITTAKNNFAVSGFDLPPGILLSQVNDLISKHNDKKADLSREISITQANLAQENTQFAIQNSVQLEGININYSNQIGERAFQFAKAAADYQISVVETKISFFNLRLKRYTDAANVHFEEIRSEVTKLEVYKASLIGIDTKIANNRLRIEAFAQSIDKLQAKINLYNAQISGFQTAIETDRVEIALYGEKISGFNSVVQHDRNLIDLHNALLRTTTTEFDKIQAQIGIHNANLDTVKTNSSTKQLELNALLEHQKNKLSAAVTDIEKYRALSGRVTQKESTLNSTFGNEINSFQALTEAEKETIKLTQENVRVKLDRAVKDMDRIVTLTKLAIDKNFKEFDFRTQTMQSVVAARQFILEAGARSGDTTSASS